MLRLILFTLASALTLIAQSSSWKFAVSGDSRNCGDIVMPAIAEGVKKSGAEFYWHLGDFRAIYEIDEDMVPPLSLQLESNPLNVSAYLTGAWPDFIQHQLVAFGALPVYLAIGNHETIPPAGREAWLLQFADWLEQPPIRAQRLLDDPSDHKLHSYYHWIDRGVDFITLDNASTDQFDAAQLAWLKKVLTADEKSREVRTIVAGMHAALPGSVGHHHSMSDWAQGDVSGRDAYNALWHAHHTGHKHVYLLASHSHFYMEDVYNTADWAGRVLPGWIVGTAGAVRYNLPAERKPGNHSRTRVYGFLTGAVSPDGSVQFTFTETGQNDLRHANPDRPDKLLEWCFAENHQ